MPLDVTDPDAIAAFAQEVIAKFPALNILVHNAGIMPFEAIDAERDLTNAETTIVTNLLGPIRLTAALVYHPAHASDSATVHVPPGLPFVPLPQTPPYSATQPAPPERTTLPTGKR